MASQQYSVRDLLPIRGDGVARPGTPTPKHVPKKIVVEESPHATSEEVYATLLRKLHAVGEKWAKKPYVPENFHKAIEDVLGVLGGRDGFPPLAATTVGEGAKTYPIHRKGKVKPLQADYKINFDFEHGVRDYRKLRTQAADLQVNDD